MASLQKSLRLPEEIVREIEEIAHDERQDFTAVTTALLTEAVRARRFPGIVISEGVRGRRARIAGSGVEVWELAAIDKTVGGDPKRLKKAFDWLTDQQIGAALAYRDRYREEIDALIAGNEAWTPERVRERYPSLGRAVGR